MIAAVDNFGKQMKEMDTKLASLEAKLVDILEEDKNLQADVKTKVRIIEDPSIGSPVLVTGEMTSSNKIGYGWSVIVFKIPLKGIVSQD
jgi:regulator of replication initiation timing